MTYCITELKCWCNDWNIIFNTSKCKVLNISKKVGKIQRSYVLNSAILETVPETTDLGLTVTNNLSWNKHIDGITLNGNRKLGLIRGFYKDISDIQTRKLLYLFLVRPQLVYASEVWSPYPTKYNYKLKTYNVVQRSSY